MSETQYNYKVVRQFAVMTVIWGIVGMLVGVLIAAQLAWPALGARRRPDRRGQDRSRLMPWTSSTC